MRRNAQIWRAFVDGTVPLSAGSLVSLSDDECHYVARVLRLGPGDEIELLNGAGMRATSRVLKSGKSGVELEVLRVETAARHPCGDIRLLVGCPKGAALDELVGLVAELGCSELHLAQTERAHGRQTVRLDRLHKVAREILRVTGSPWNMRVFHHDSLAGACEHVKPAALRWFVADESPLYDGGDGGHRHLAASLSDEDRAVGICIGPESSFTDGERALLAESLNALFVGLGPLVLRVPVAAAAAVACCVARISGNLTRSE